MQPGGARWSPVWPAAIVAFHLIIDIIFSALIGNYIDIAD